jgi:hypothetical protein
MGLNQIKNVFHIKGNNYQNRDNPQNGEKIFASYLSNKGLIPTTYTKIKN